MLIIIEILKECKGFFDQLASYMIVMDMLMKANRYEDVLKLWQHFNDNGNFEQRFPRDIVLLVLAACYKLVRTLLRIQ